MILIVRNVVVDDHYIVSDRFEVVESIGSPYKLGQILTGDEIKKIKDNYHT